MNTSEKLDQLSDFQAQIDLIAIKKQELLDQVTTYLKNVGYEEIK
jgi:hypothetical protein